MIKQRQGFSIASAIVGTLAITVMAIIIFLIIDSNQKATRYDDYDLSSIIQPNDHNGNIGDHVKGNPDAPVIIVEYADFQCEYCALMNPRINTIIEENNGNLAVIYRNFLLSYHQNGTAAASAAEAAGLQGYWKEYSDKLFSEQSEWAYTTPSERTALFNQYFTDITNGEGDLEKFNQDISSSNVSQKISFDMGIGKQINISGTPSLYLDGELIDFGNKNGGQITVNGQVISWDGAQSGDDFNTLIKKIVDAKLSTN